MDAYAYMRCSGLGQNSGDTWERQEEAIQRYAASNGITVVQWFRDTGIPGKTELEGRAGLSDCLASCRENGVLMVIVEDSSRFARDMIVAEICVREFQRLGVRVIAAAGAVDLTAGDDMNPTAKLVRQILAAISEFDKNVIVLKTRAARQRIRAKTGRCEGRKGFGFHDSEKPALALMLALRNEGHTLRAIAAKLNEQNLPSRMGGPWKAGSVARILGRSE